MASWLSGAVPPPVMAVSRPADCSALRAEALLAWRRALLASSGGTAAHLDWLLDLVGGLSWPQLQALHLHPQRSVVLARPLEELEALWWRHRRTGEPLQYLVGRCPWRDLELEVDPAVLIPRQETELLVDLALTLLPCVESDSPIQWVDLGTGSGCLALALARALPGSRGWAVDASAAAQAVAARNLAAAPAQPAPPQGAAPPAVRLLHCDWWQGLEPQWGALQLAVANPPYIPTATVAALDPMVRDHEPHLALDGGTDGLACLRVIVAGAATALAPGGLLVVEHHHDQSSEVLALATAAGLEEARAHPDLEGVARFVSARRPRSGAAR